MRFPSGENAYGWIHRLFNLCRRSILKVASSAPVSVSAMRTTGMPEGHAATFLPSGDTANGDVLDRAATRFPL